MWRDRSDRTSAEFEAEVKTCLERIGITLKAAGMSYRDAVSVQVYLTDMDRSYRDGQKVAVTPRGANVGGAGSSLR